MALTDALKETLKVVEELGEASVKEIAEELGISPSGARKRLARLVDEGLVKKVIDDRKVKFMIEEAAEETAEETEETEGEEATEEEETAEETEETEGEEATEEEEAEDLVDIYINGKYTISVEPERASDVVKRCNPNAEFDYAEGNKRYYIIKSGSKG